MMSFSLGLGARTAKAANVFDPATLSLSGWWRASYGGSPWSPTASAGSSGSNGNLAEATFAPSVGSAVNGYTPADFISASPDYLTNSNNVTTFGSTTASTVIVVFYADAADAPTGSVYDDAPLFRDADADYGLMYTTSGVTAMAYDGAYRSVSVAAATGAWHIAMLRHNGSNLGMTVDSGAESTTACGTLTLYNGTLILGYGYGGTHIFDGRILEVMTASSALSNTDFSNIKSYVNSRYALAL